ncbi:hypothetical protein ANACOL_04425 [Anaerotruncus colihominis DSM 17241]|uniref:Uncharacterized protein n=1 Tax=Anaerotruncus colihominis DSM 17241 TaxID=445972 RepID=B0PHY1_9FIRM|nr:hypothetical protein ANACOL_04425 [Anaerotruncus colihominis DSM 17241]
MPINTKLQKFGFKRPNIQLVERFGKNMKRLQKHRSQSGRSMIK